MIYWESVLQERMHIKVYNKHQRIENRNLDSDICESETN